MLFDIVLSIIIWSAIAGNLFLGILVAHRKPLTDAHKSLVANAAIMTIWGACLYFYAHPWGIPSESWLRIVYSLVLPLIGAFFHFSFVFPLSQKQNTKKPMLIWFFSACFFFYLINFTKLYLITVVHTSEGYHQELGPLFPLFAVWAISLSTWALWNYFKSYTKVQGHEKIQLQYVFFGMALYAWGTIIPDLFFPILFHNSLYIWASSAAAIFFVGSISYVILRHRFLDIEVILRKGIVYTLLFATTMMIYTLSIYAMTSMFTVSISQLVATFIISVTIIPLKDFFETATDKIFFKKHYTFQAAVKELTQILLQHPRLDELLNQILALLTNLLKVERVAVLVRTGEGEYVCRASVGVTNIKMSLHRNDSAIIRLFEEQAKNPSIHSFTIIDKNERIHELLSKGESKQGIDTDPIVHELMSFNMMIALPLFAHQELEGFIVLGEKRSGDPYGSQDMEFLEVLSQETAASMENAISFEQLKELDDIKSELISVVSHQLRTPLSVTRWNMELLLGNDFGTLSDKVHDVVDKTYAALSTLNQGLNNLMMALEIEEGHPLKAIDAVDITTQIDQALHELTRIREQKHITIQKKYGYTQSITADVTKIKIILEILLDNAHKYSPENGTVTIETKETINEGVKECLLSIEDNGIGIPVEHRDLVFNKFFRGEDAKHISPNGFGLGLFIARSFAQMHGGKLWIGEKETPGTLFFVSLPKTPNSHIGSLLPHQK
jgi:signal transduction histidine kinase